MSYCLGPRDERAVRGHLVVFRALAGGNQAGVHRRLIEVLFQQTLEEEKDADKKLSGLAEGGINQSAADAAHSEEGETPEATAARGVRKIASNSGRR